MSSHCLLTFLHKASPSFKSANYDFGDNHVCAEVHFGLALLDQLSSNGRSPDKLIVLGTSGSSWGRIIAHTLPEDAALGIDALNQACDTNKATTDQLAPWCEPVSEAMRRRIGAPIKVVLQVIDYAADAEGQRSFIASVAAHVPQNAVVTLDPTHSLRHLPLLGTFSVMALRRLKNVSIGGIYFGALEMTPPLGATPVWRLDALPGIADWLAALSAYDKDGDYGVFETLLVQGGLNPEVAARLGNAAFCETTGNIEKARERLKMFLDDFESSALHGISALFAHELRARLSWVDKNDIYERQRRLAFAALDRGDAARTATWGFEAFVTGLAKRSARNPYLRKTREQARLGNYPPPCGGVARLTGIERGVRS